MQVVSGGGSGRARLVIVALLATVITTAAVTGTGMARVVAQTKVTIRPTLPLYHGKVKSDFPECVKGRKVFLFRKKSGPDQKIGKDKANAHGYWRVSYPGNPPLGAKFYAKVRNYDASEPGPGTGLGCSRDKSQTITFVGG